jgi:hypothetical protein
MATEAMQIANLTFHSADISGDISALIKMSFKLLGFLKAKMGGSYIQRFSIKFEYSIPQTARIQYVQGFY